MLARLKNALPECGIFALLTGLNMWIAWRLFWVEYTPNWSSIEGSFIGLARHISLHWGDFDWWTIWHCGMPYQDTYVPLFHLTVASVTTLMHWPAAHAYHAVTGLTYSLAPATLFLMARVLGATRPAALFAGFAFTFFSPSALLIPAFGADLVNPLAGRRLQVLTVYGEGPHITALALLPVAMLALEYARRKPTGRALALAALAIATMFLTNVPGSMALSLAVFCWLSVQDAQRLVAWKIAAGAAALAYMVACYGVPPSSLGTVFGNVGPMHSGFSQSLKHSPYWLPLLIASIAGLGYGLARTRLPLFARFGLAYFLLTLVLVRTARLSEKFELLPQAGRLHLEMELGASLVLGWLVWLLYRWRWTRYAVVAFGLAVLFYQSKAYRWRARIDIAPAKVEERSEYVSARWIDANLAGRRVYTAGSTSFWFNAFTDTPQMTGCCEQGRSMVALAAVPYLVQVGVTEEYTRLGITWLQAMGVHAIVVNGPESNDEYKDYRKPGRFEGLLPVLHRERGDTIYQIPQRTASLAHVLHAGEALAPVPSGVPGNADVTRYVNAIESPDRPDARCDWLRSGKARIRARLERGDEIIVQAAYVPGWKAKVGGAARPVLADGIGFVLIRPQCEGDCEINLEWSGPSDIYLSALISLAGLVLAGWLMARQV
jgi:hypothetical protein